MDWAQAIHYAQLVKAAEEIQPCELCEPRLVIGTGEGAVEYTRLLTVFANDLATDCNQARRELIVSIGFVAQSVDGDVVVAIRGTTGIHEWLHDCNYHAVPCGIVPDAGHTEDGFTEIYESLRAEPAVEALSLREVIAAMGFPRPVRRFTVCGHSLGAALATLLSLDLAANTQYTDVTLFTYASPRLGDEQFAEVFQRTVPQTYRIANRLDLVTETPPAFLCHHVPYRHVETTMTLVPGVDVGHHIVCMHHLTTYLYLMAVEAKVGEGGDALVPECCREKEHSWVRSLERHHRHGGTQGGESLQLAPGR